MGPNFDVYDKSTNMAGSCRITWPRTVKKSFNIIDLPLGALRMYRHNKPEKVTVPPLASKHLLGQVRERMCCIDYSSYTDTK